MAKMGRPVGTTELTPELSDRIVAMVRTGVFYQDAAAAAGIHRTTLRTWIRRGSGGEEPYVQFAQDIELAFDQASARILTGIAKAGKESWQALAWILERTRGETYRLKTSTTVEIRGNMEKLLEEIKPRMSQGAYDELVDAIL